MKDYRDLVGRIATQLCPELTREFYDMMSDIVGTYEIERSKLKNILKILFDKNVDIDFLKSADTFEEYNKLIKVNITFAIVLTQDEFNLIKEYLKNECNS